MPRATHALKVQTLPVLTFFAFGPAYAADDVTTAMGAPRMGAARVRAAARATAFQSFLDMSVSFNCGIRVEIRSAVVTYYTSYFA
jgi:hypothetical protein